MVARGKTEQELQDQKCIIVTLCIVFFVIVGISLLIATQSSMAIGNPSVRTLSTADLAKAPIALADYQKTYQIPAGWMGGVVFQERWQKSYGWNGDPYNNVRIRVYIPNKLITVIPCGPRQEAGFIQDYVPGDIVGIAWDGIARVGQVQDTVFLCKEDMVMMQQGGALASSETREVNP